MRGARVAAGRQPQASIEKRVRVRMLADSAVAMGPGKADLLDAIALRECRRVSESITKSFLKLLCPRTS